MSQAMMDDKPKRKNQPTIPRWKRIIHYLLPFLLLGVPYLIARLAGHIYNAFDASTAILPIVMLPLSFWSSISFIVIALSLILIYRLQLHILAYVAYFIVNILWLFVGIILLREQDAFVIKNPVVHTDLLYQIIQIEYHDFFPMDGRPLGHIILYCCDSLGWSCDKIQQFRWGPSALGGAFDGYWDMPDAILEQTGDSIRLIINDEVIHEIPLDND